MFLINFLKLFKIQLKKHAVWKFYEFSRHSINWPVWDNPLRHWGWRSSRTSSRRSTRLGETAEFAFWPEKSRIVSRFTNYKFTNNKITSLQVYKLLLCESCWKSFSFSFLVNSQFTTKNASLFTMLWFSRFQLNWPICCN